MRSRRAAMLVYLTVIGLVLPLFSPIIPARAAASWVARPSAQHSVLITPDVRASSGLVPPAAVANIAQVYRTSLPLIAGGNVAATPTSAWAAPPNQAQASGSPLDTTGHFSNFAVLQQKSQAPAPAPPDPSVVCDPAVGSGNGIPSGEADAIINAYKAAQSHSPTPGCPAAPASVENGLWTQHLSSGARIVAGFYLAADYAVAYDNAIAQGVQLGAPTEHSFNAQPALDYYRDTTHSFVGSPAQNFEHGFIGTSGGLIGAYQFPRVCEITVNTDQTVVPTPRSPDLPPDAPDPIGTRYITVTAQLKGDPAPQAPAGAASFTAVSAQLTLDSAAQGNVTLTQSGDAYVGTLATFNRPDDGTV